MIPIAFTLMYDLMPVEQRGKLGGIFGAVFGLASIFGPVLGGAFTLVSAVVSLMIVLKLGGKLFPWDSLPIIGLFSAFVVLVILFFVAETRAAEPIISLQMFSSRLYSTSNAIAVTAGTAFVTSSVYIPIYIQGVLGGSAVEFLQ
ncbi:hypothetical protein J2T13_000896 [Paenibacillus sp. DS2015]|uniref:MFS transporter n=1 Tax=Paenibacillus sp. DS2015 TaxID=3373917 RepID=UPI003D1A0680